MQDLTASKICRIFKSVTVVQNETYLSPECFELVLYFVERVRTFFRVVKMTRGGEEIFFTVFKFGLRLIYQG